MGAMKGKFIIVSTVILLLLTILTGYMWVDLGTNSESNTASASATLYSEDIVTQIYQDVSPAVVEIYVTQQTTSIMGSYDQDSLGSGFLIDNEGHILTNNHVVDEASSLEVVLLNGKSVSAKVIGTDAADDLALIQVDSSAVSGITPLTLGDSDSVKPGQMAIAIGSPYGLNGSITVGIISGLGRSITSSVGRPITGLLQTDAAINPGNSGGPLLDSEGKVIGINTAIENPMTGAQGIGFAVSINTAKDQLESLLEGRNVKRPWLGISGTAIRSALVEELGLSVDSGVYVIEVTADSPADEAGLIGGGTDSNDNLLAGGDIITAVDGNEVKKVEDLVSYFNTKDIGDDVLLTVVREGNTIRVEVTLGTWPDSIDETTNIQPQATPEDTPTPAPTATPELWEWHFPWSMPR